MPGIPMTSAGIAAVRAFEVAALPLPTPTKTYSISGTTKDSTGGALAGCSLVLLRVADNSVAALGASDGNGAYQIAASPALLHRLDAVSADGTLAGSTLPALVGS